MRSVDIPNVSARLKLGKSAENLWGKFVPEITIFNLEIKWKSTKIHQNYGFRTVFT